MQKKGVLYIRIGFYWNKNSFLFCIYFYLHYICTNILVSLFSE